eukprot:524714-Rhodomonas_salina.1
MLKALRPRATAITVMGDMNATVVRDREGYSTDMTVGDDSLMQWVRDEGFQRSEREYEFTWKSPSGPQQAHLDYMLT